MLIYVNIPFVTFAIIKLRKSACVLIWWFIMYKLTLKVAYNLSIDTFTISVITPNIC